MAPFIKPTSIKQALKMGGRLLPPDGRFQRVVMSDKIGDKIFTRIFSAIDSTGDIHHSWPDRIRISKVCKGGDSITRTKLDSYADGASWRDYFYKTQRNYANGKLDTIEETYRWGWTKKVCNDKYGDHIPIFDECEKISIYPADYKQLAKSFDQLF